MSSELRDSMESHQKRELPTETAAGDSTDTDTDTETGFPALKKAKTEVKGSKVLREGGWKDPEFERQLNLFWEQFDNSEGYDLEWDKFCYRLPALPLEWCDFLGDREECIEELINYAIEVENEETGTNLEFTEYVSATVQGCEGFLFFITFRAQDLSEPNALPKLYRAQVRKFGDEIFVYEFMLRPSQHLP